MNAPQSTTTFNGANSAFTNSLYRVATASILSKSLIALAVTLLAFFMVVSGILYDMKSASRTIIKDTAPSVVAAQQIKASLSNIDASAVNATLLRGPAADAAWKEFELEQRILSDYLVTSSQNITYGDDEKNPLVEIIASLQAYSDLIGQARIAIADSVIAKTPPGTTDATTLDLLLRAANIMNNKMITSANALNAANEAVLEETWATRNTHKAADYLSLLATSAIVLLVLAAIQITVWKRSSRLVNPALLAATLAFVASVAFLIIGMASSDHHLRIAKEDAFDSVRSMWKTRAIAYSLNADESYYLLDPAQKDKYAAKFVKKLELIAGPGFYNPGVIADYTTLSENMLAGKCQIPPKGGSRAAPGLIGEELLNITFDYECQEAANLIPLLGKYVNVDFKIHSFDTAGNRNAALALDLGEEPGQSNYLFSKFNQELGLVIYINQMAFETNARKAIGDLSFLNIILAGSSLLTLALAYLGLRPRLAEYPKS